MECFCQPVAFSNSLRPTPWGRLSRARILAVLVAGRGPTLFGRRRTAAFVCEVDSDLPRLGCFGRCAFFDECSVTEVVRVRVGACTDGNFMRCPSYGLRPDPAHHRSHSKQPRKQVSLNLFRSPRIAGAVAGDWSLSRTRGMSVGMKNGQKNVLPFPPPAAPPEVATIIVQIGNERFAIHWEVEDLPPASKPLAWRKPPLGAA